jgi:REP element-mobilizing transposase RayT
VGRYRPGQSFGSRPASVVGSSARDKLWPYQVSQTAAVILAKSLTLQRRDRWTLLARSVLRRPSGFRGRVRACLSPCRDGYLPCALENMPELPYTTFMKRPWYSERYRGRSIRLPDFDYGLCGAYFVTICTAAATAELSIVSSNGLVLNDAGRMAAQQWLALRRRFPSISLDTFIVMPDHIHGILEIKGVAGSENCADQADPVPSGPHVRSRATLPRVIQAYKSLTTREYAYHVRVHGWPGFENRLWQRNYYEHIIADPNEMAAVRSYILDNPRRRWERIQSGELGPEITRREPIPFQARGQAGSA